MLAVESTTKAEDLTNAIVQMFIRSKVNFIFNHRTSDQCITITAVKDCDKAKFYFPAFEIKTDSRMKRYAELVINYE